jgi:hypothetical protein
MRRAAGTDRRYQVRAVPRKARCCRAQQVVSCSQVASILRYYERMRSAPRSSIPASLVLLAASFALVGATRCGGSAKSDLGTTAGSNQGGDAAAGVGTSGGSASSAGAVSAGPGGTGGGSGSGNAGSPSSCGGASSTPVGRPIALACAPTVVANGTLGQPGEIAHPQACAVDGDCADAGQDAHCLSGKCDFDQCLGDSDCSSGQTCICASQLRGNAGRGNACISSGCRVDADCGANGACSPDDSGYCGSVTGYRCHTAADACNSNADCCGSTPRCGYQAELGHWACAAVIGCSG